MKFAQALLVWVGFCLIATGAVADTPAKRLFGSKALPADLAPAAHGFYSKGCISGATAMPIDGPHWQVMRLSRNRRWGHPDLIAIIEDLSYKAKASGWNGLLVGDISQPRGGPMLTGHRSHQLGLDADIWFTQMPNKRMTYQEREDTSAISVLKRKSVYVDDRRWPKAATALLRHAASYAKVERILVHPGIKKKLCDTVKGDRSWLNKIRPFWGHHYHFHIRIGCPAGSPNCRKQKSTGRGTGCDSSLDWWFKVAFGPKKKPKKGKKTKAKKPRQLVLSDLPPACRPVLSANAIPVERAEHKVRETAFVAPEISLPKFSAALAARSKPIEAKAANAGIARSLGVEDIPIPTKRPK